MLFAYSALVWVLSYVMVASCKRKIVGGDLAPMDQFSHSVFLLILDRRKYHSCGSSILNQKILITAAHCIIVENKDNRKVIAFFGNSNRKLGLMIKVNHVLMHEDFEMQPMNNDIAMLVLKRPVELGTTIRRVAIMSDPPYSETAIIAGWGLIDDVNRVKTNDMKYAKQEILPKEECEEILGTLLDGFFCATSEHGYATQGDSGSALIVRDYIQIGVASFRRISNKAIMVYTDVGYYYEWIAVNANYLLCADLHGVLLNTAEQKKMPNQTRPWPMLVKNVT